MKIVVVGGVAAGMSAAARARRLDETADIVVLEKGRHVSFANCGLPYHIGGQIKERDQLLLQTPESLKSALNLDVRIGHEVRGIDRQRHRVLVTELETGREYEEPYDKLALCPGATPVRPGLPGIDNPRVLVLRNVDDMDRIKGAVDGGASRAVVIGGGYIGVEMAESLRERGLKVDLIEMVNQLMPPLDREMARDLENHMRRHGVTLHLGVAAAAFKDEAGNLTVELTNGVVLAADVVILSAGVRPDATLARLAGLEIGPRGGIKVNPHMQTSDPDIYAAGDAVEVVDTVTGEAAVIPLAGPANRQGRVAGENMCGRTTRYTTTQGTAIVKVFEMTGGGTGATEKALKRAGRAFLKIYLHPSGHAGYYPGSAPMHIKVLFEPGSGRLLGAQVVGFDGVDKRLDVFATAIRAGMTVYDLERLELAYAPPYGSAKDPVNMAGFMGANLLNGDVRFWYAEEFPAGTDGAFILDVRGPQEFALGHIPGAVNIPLGRLRCQLDRVPRDRPVRVYCKVGFRSYLAYRILRQRGIEDVATLAGGLMTFSSCHEAGRRPGAPEPAVLAYAEESAAAGAGSGNKGGNAFAGTANATQENVTGADGAGGDVVDLDCTGLQCPGPIKRVKEAMERMEAGRMLQVRASDPGFEADIVAWCKRQAHEVVNVTHEGSVVQAMVRKGSVQATEGEVATVKKDKKTFVVFSGDLDKVMAAFVIANGALAMGNQVTMFFTFWGINALRKAAPQAAGKRALDWMFGRMMPKGPGRLKLSNMNMLGMGTALMKYVMKSKRVESLPDLMAAARAGGARIVVCSMSMEVMGIRREELIDGIDVGGVATFLGEADQSNVTLFI